MRSAIPDELARRVVKFARPLNAPNQNAAWAGAQSRPPSDLPNQSDWYQNFSNADEVKNPPKASVEVVKLGNVNASKLVLEPGWKWSTCIKPTVGGESCQAGHVGVVISGSMTCTSDDGSEITVGAGDAYYFAPGHDGWVNGNEPCVLYEIVEGGKDFGPWKHAH